VIPLLLFVAALAVRVLAAIGYGDPAYPDSFYYANLARQLAEGHGLTIDYVWNFVDVGGRIPEQAILPIPSNAHWMPLAALVQLPFLALFGAGTVGHGLAFWLVGAATAPLAYWIGRDAGFGRLASIAGGALCAVPGATTQFLSQPDNFALYMPLGALALWLCGRGLRGDRRAFVLGGAVVGLATLSRNDGVLLGVPFAGAFLVERVTAWREGLSVSTAGRIGWRAAFGCAGGFLLLTAPWYLRQLSVFGSLSPSAENGRILFIRDYNELWSAGARTTLDTFLAQGPVDLVLSRAGGLVMALVIFAGLPLLLYLAPFSLIGAWHERRNPLVVPWIVYAITLFAFNGLLFAVHVPFGTFLHSAVALAPHAYLLAAVGVALAIEWAARWRPHWDVPRATAVFTTAAVVIAALGAAGSVLRGESNWRREDEVRAPIMAALAAAPSGERVMSPDAGAYRFHAGRPGIVTPNDPLPVVEQALRSYDVRWLVLERAHLVPSLKPLLEGTEHPAWLSRPVVVVPADEPASAATGSTAPLPAAALYAVCLEPADQRCAS
jgi:Dolichyl-phosphate-mannose-protein mannosyltransferase